MLALTAAAALAAMGAAGDPDAHADRQAPGATPGPRPAARPRPRPAPTRWSSGLHPRRAEGVGPALRGSRQGPLAQRDRHLRHARTLPAHRDGPHRLHARARPAPTTTPRAWACWPTLAAAPASGSSPRATSGWWPPEPRSASTRARPTTWARWRLARQRAGGRRAALGALARRGGPRARASGCGRRRAACAAASRASCSPRRGARGARVRWVRDDGTGNSDHREFQLAGLPAAKLGVAGRGEPCRHMPVRPRRPPSAAIALKRDRRPGREGSQDPMRRTLLIIAALAALPAAAVAAAAGMAQTAPVRHRADPPNFDVTKRRRPRSAIGVPRRAAQRRLKRRSGRGGAVRIARSDRDARPGHPARRLSHRQAPRAARARSRWTTCADNAAAFGLDAERPRARCASYSSYTTPRGLRHVELRQYPRRHPGFRQRASA